MGPVSMTFHVKTTTSDHHHQQQHNGEVHQGLELDRTLMTMMMVAVVVMMMAIGCVAVVR